MSTRTVVVLVCDLCGTDDLVSTHTLTVDGTARVAEVCDADWQRIIEAVAPFAKAGRAPEVTKVSGRKQVVSFPGEPWEFASHCLVRMGERHITPRQAIEAAEAPQVVHPGLEPELEVRIKGNVKAVVNAKRRVIVTVSKRSEEVESVA